MRDGKEESYSGAAHGYGRRRTGIEAAGDPTQDLHFDFEFLELLFRDRQLCTLRGRDNFFSGVLHGFGDDKVQAGVFQDLAALLHVGSLEAQHQR